MNRYCDPEAPLYVPMRFNHSECSQGKDDCLLVTRFPSMWKWYCHRCKEHGIIKMDNLPPEDVIKLWKSNNIQKNKPRQSQEEIRLPMDFTNNIQNYPNPYIYLMGNGITDEEIVKYNIGYSHYYKRVIFPVYQNDELVYWQGRTIEELTKDNPKWINIKKVGREDVYFNATGPGSGVVLVEDILSAIKVARVRSCTALLGSYISNRLKLSLINCDVMIWLDYDKKKEAMDYAMGMRAMGINTNFRVTRKDPKEYSTEEIKEILK